MEYELIGNEVSVEGAVVQATQALDIAGRFATDQRDTDTLLKVAEAWKDVAEFIIALADHDEKKEKESTKADVPFGITPSKPEDPEVVDLTDAEGESVITDEEENEDEDVRSDDCED